MSGPIQVMFTDSSGDRALTRARLRVDAWRPNAELETLAARVDADPVLDRQLAPAQRMAVGLYLEARQKAQAAAELLGVNLGGDAA